VQAAIPDEFEALLKDPYNYRLPGVHPLPGVVVLLQHRCVLWVADPRDELMYGMHVG
jgi:hypothetical protein